MSRPRPTSSPDLPTANVEGITAEPRPGGGTVVATDRRILRGSGPDGQHRECLCEGCHRGVRPSNRVSTGPLGFPGDGSMPEGTAEPPPLSPGSACPYRKGEAVNGRSRARRGRGAAPEHRAALAAGAPEPRSRRRRTVHGRLSCLQREPGERGHLGVRGSPFRATPSDGVGSRHPFSSKGRSG